MAAELGQAYVQIIPSAQGISGSISSVLEPEATSAGKKAGLNIAGGIGSALKGATTIVAAGTAAVTGAIVKGSSDVASYGDNIDKMSQKMGMSAQAYQEWDAVMQHSGTSMETMKASMKTLANAAETGNAAFETLGITQEQIAGMNQEQLFEATIAALQNVENETERTYLAGKVLGKGATELGALLNTSAEDTQAMRDRVHELGGVMSDDAVKAAAAFQDNMQDMQTALSGVGRNMISQLLPSMNGIIAGFTSLIIGEEGATDAISQGFSDLFKSLDGIAQNIVSTLTEMMPSIISGITEILPQIIDMATTLLISIAEALVDAMPQIVTTVIPSLLSAAVRIVVALGQAIVEAAPQLLDAGKQLFEMLKGSFSGGDMLTKGMETVQGILDGITQALPGLLNEGVEIITNLANGILENLPSLITTAGEIITTFASFILENLPTIVESGMNLLLNLVNGIVDNLPQIVTAVVQVIAKFIATIAQNLPKIIQSGIEIIGKLIVGLLQAIPKIVAAIPQIITAIKNAFTSVNWGEVGINLIKGIANGITGAIGWIVDAAKSVAKSAFDTITGWLQIESPSKKGVYIGQMLDEGFAGGIEANADLVDDAVSDISKDAVVNLQSASAQDYNFNAQAQQSESKLEQLIAMMEDYLPQLADGMTAQVILEGDAEGLFKVVRDKNKVYKKMNGESAFA